ncbi:MAG: MBL fold metallo-hydrolase [Elusimicrobiales bacterium]|jgi:metallo-beta-lactamase family protein
MTDAGIAAKISFFGAAGEVTGSRHLLEAGDKKILLDCGMFQGHRQESLDKNRSFPVRPAELDAVLLSHAHIDHSGGLPLLAKKGLKAGIYCTAATKELASIMLMDSARLQVADAKFFNKVHQSEGLRIEPLYNEEDARLALTKFKACDFGAEAHLAGGTISARFLNAGHVLGSAMVLVTAPSGAQRRRVLYTGDLGRRASILMRSPEIPREVDYLIMETTYGDRLHDPVDDAEARLAAVIKRAVAEKGKVIIPSFALERAQEIILILDKMRRAGTALEIPVFVDSPMTVSITELFNKYKGSFSFDERFKEYAKTDKDPFGFDYINYVRTKEESQALNEMDGPMIIISASGMCEGGRVLHHLRNNIDKENATVLLVGYQAAGTLGRRLQDGARKVKIFGLEHEVAARVEAMHFFSSHADKGDLVAFVKGLSRPPRKIFLVHGDPADRAAFVETLKAEGITNTVCPEFGQSFELE